MVEDTFNIRQRIDIGHTLRRRAAMLLQPLQLLLLIDHRQLIHLFFDLRHVGERLLGMIDHVHLLLEQRTQQGELLYRFLIQHNRAGVAHQVFCMIAQTFQVRRDFEIGNDFFTVSLRKLQRRYAVHILVDLMTAGIDAAFPFI